MGVLKEILRRRKEAESGVGHTLSEHETKVVIFLNDSPCDFYRVVIGQGCRVCATVFHSQMIEDVAKGSITEVVLHAKLREAVEKSDAEAALEHAATTGRSKANIEARPTASRGLCASLFTFPVWCCQGIFIRPILEPSVDAPTIKNPTLAFQLSSSFRLELTD
jgi:hypothetical protein